MNKEPKNCYKMWTRRYDSSNFSALLGRFYESFNCPDLQILFTEIGIIHCQLREKFEVQTESYNVTTKANNAFSSMGLDYNIRMVQSSDQSMFCPSVLDKLCSSRRKFSVFVFSEKQRKQKNGNRPLKDRTKEKTRTQKHTHTHARTDAHALQFCIF